VLVAVPLLLIRRFGEPTQGLITEAVRQHVRDRLAQVRRSMPPLPGELRLRLRCVAPTRSSLSQASFLLFPFFAFRFAANYIMQVL
jgi:hypothetical protein